MRNRIVRLLAVGVSAALIFSFAACGNKGSDGDTTSGTNTEAVAVLEPVEPASAAETESVAETETETPTQAEPDSKTDGGSSDGGQDDPQGGADGDSGSGQQNGGGSGSGQIPQPDPDPIPKPDFDPDTVIEMVHQKIKANPDLMWFYDHPNVPPDVPCDMGWLEVPGNFYPTMTMEEIAQRLYESALVEYNDGGCNLFYVEYLGTRDDGCYCWKLYRGTLT
ncbi:MAG TPA: hypothetical protein IAB39_09505 [Candidatus Onthovicinus excrementipullorum]|nr:hypothetical protein [Candidatus Onthovicinus excrementipullorum]